MIDPVAPVRPRVALVFGETVSAGHLRDAVAAQVEIVYDTSAQDFDTARLVDSGATAALVNLDGCDWVDSIEARLADAGIPVVFNDPDVSSSLEGWDRARWLRHLTAKLCQSVDFDPPRPALRCGGNAMRADAASADTVPPATVVPAADDVLSDAGGPDPDDSVLDVDTEALSAMIDARLAEAQVASPHAVAGVVFADPGIAAPPGAPEAIPPGAADAPQPARPIDPAAADDDPFAELPALAEWQLVDPDAPVVPGTAPVNGRAQPASLPDNLADLQLVPMEASSSVELHTAPIEHWMHVEARRRTVGDHEAAASRGHGRRGEPA